MAGVTFDTGNGAGAAPVGEGRSWEAIEAEIVRRHANAHQIATVWHPAPRGEVVSTDRGNVRVLVGDVAEYQLTTGEKIAL